MEMHTSVPMGLELEDSAIHLLHRVGQCAADIYQSEMNGADLTPRQFAILIAVSQNEGLSQTRLVEKTGIDRSTLADIVRRMLRKGLLQRRRTKDDARAYSVKLTDEGQAVLNSAVPRVSRVDNRLLSVLPEERREKFLKDLEQIVTELANAQAQVAADIANRTSKADARMTESAAPNGTALPHNAAASNRSTFPA